MLLRFELKLIHRRQVANLRPGMFRPFIKFLLLLTFALMADRSANASCGDYLHTKYSKPTEMDGHSARHATDSTAADTTTLTNHPAGTHSTPAAPCHGPQCRQRNDWPMPLVPSAAEVRTLSDAVLYPLPDEGHNPRFCRLPAVDSANAADGFADRIDRPPRLST